MFPETADEYKRICLISLLAFPAQIFIFALINIAVLAAGVLVMLYTHPLTLVITIFALAIGQAVCIGFWFIADADKIGGSPCMVWHYKELRLGLSLKALIAIGCIFPSFAIQTIRLSRVGWKIMRLDEQLERTSKMTKQLVKDTGRTLADSIKLRKKFEALAQLAHR